MKHSIHDLLTERHVGGVIQYYPNPGNAGDALIASATWQCFDQLGIQPMVVRPEEFQKGANVVLGGGGNLVPYYRGMARALEMCMEKEVASCLLLPHSIRGHEDLLARLDRRFTLVCREQSSFEHARQHAPGATVLLGDDMALGLDFDRLARRVATLQHRLALLFDRDWRRHRRGWRAALARMKPDGDGRLTILRGDREAATDEARNEAYDLPRYYNTPCRHRAGCDRVAFDLCNLLAGVRSVRTDRLHVALPAAKLGIEVEILDNSYGKLSGVWRTSLEERYPNARLVHERHSERAVV